MNQVSFVYSTIWLQNCWPASLLHKVHLWRRKWTSAMPWLWTFQRITIFANHCWATKHVLKSTMMSSLIIQTKSEWKSTSWTNSYSWDPRLKTTRSLENLQSLDQEVGDTATWLSYFKQSFTQCKSVWHNQKHISWETIDLNFDNQNMVLTLTKVGKVRLVKAQARAVLAEMRKSGW